MRCSFERLPSHIIELMNFCTRSLPKTESGGTSRRTMNPLRGIRYLHREGLQLEPKLAYFCAALGRLAPYFERPCLRFSTPAASSVPAGCARYPVCTWSLRCCSSGARGRPCAERSSASWASACKRECTHRAFPGIPAALETSSWSGSDRVRNEPVVQTSARLSLNRAKIQFTIHIAAVRDAACQRSSRKERAQ